MYPQISDLINDLLGTNICLPIQSFGFFVAVAFMAAYWLLRQELRRKTREGIFPTYPVTVMEGGPIAERDVLIFTLIWGLIGYKLGLLFGDYNLYCHHPQDLILSTEGSWPWAIGMAVVAGAYQFWLYRQRKDTKPEKVKTTHGIVNESGTVLTLAFVLGIIGAKIFHNLEYWDNFVADPIGALLSFDGLTFYGGLIFATVGIAWYVIRRGYQVWPFADAVAPGLMLAYGIGRMGCQTSGDGDWGIVNPHPKPDWLSWAPDWLWKFDYPHNVLNEGVPIPGCEGEYCHRLAEAVYPTPVYEIVMAGIIFAGLMLLRTRLPYWGQLSGIYLFFNGLERFLIEKIRVNSVYHIGGFEITQAEIISSILMLAGIGLFLVATLKWKKNTTTVKIRPVAPPKT